MATKDQIIEGFISINGKGTGYVKDPEGGKDIVIAENEVNHALHKDTVKVRITGFITDQPQGVVLEIISRNKTKFVGTTYFENDICLVLPDNKRINIPFILDGEKVEVNQKVFIELSNWDKYEKSPHANLIKIIGPKGNHDVEMESIVLDRGFDYVFTPEIEKEAHELKKLWFPIPDEEISKRKDLRDKQVFTIDPVDAKDFDDALHIEKLANGNFEIGVHIADVSHYVSPGTEIDKEAQERQFSVYLVDRTIPMLPETLSNDLCSLNPNEDKLAFSAVFEINTDAHVVSKWFGKSVIKSVKRFNYEEAQDILDKGQGTLFEELNTLNILAKKMAKEKYNAGAINFEKDEIKFELDENGVPLRIYKKQRIDTNKLIEEFMLLANREIAEYLYKESIRLHFGNDNGLMYRVHDVPDKDKIRDLSIFLRALGYNLPIRKDGSIIARDINELLEKTTGTPEETLIKSATIKTMSKAIYSPFNTGHFGLAFEFYTHFTSPIRRYPDLLVHRILFKLLNSRKIEEREFDFFEKMALKASDREIQAADAERDSIKYKQVEYMMGHIGKEIKGVISGVSPWGIYVMDEETLSEGMVHISRLGEDYFTFDEKQYAIVGQKTGKKFVLGDEIKVKIDSADLDTRQLMMSIII